MAENHTFTTIDKIWAAIVLFLVLFAPSVVMGQASWNQVSNLPVNFPLDRGDSAQIKVVGSDFILAAMEAPYSYPYESKLKLIKVAQDDGAHSLRAIRETSNYNGQELILEDFLVKPSGDLLWGGMREHGEAIIGELTYPDWDAEGDGRTGADVTSLLQAEVDRQGGNYFWFHVYSGDLGGDPAPGKVKTLWVTYKTTSGTYTAEVREYDVFEIPGYNHSQISNESSASGIEIVSGLYGIEDGSNAFTTYRLDERIDGYYSLYDLAVTNVAHGAGKYVLAAGTPTQGDDYYGSDRVGGLFYSDDAEHWTPVVLPLEVQINDLSYQNNLFVACGRFSEDPYYYYPYAEYGDGVVLFSSDGINWSIQLISTDGALNSLIWDGTDWITVGENGVILKWEGMFWDEIMSPTTENIEAVVYANGHLIIGTEGGELYSTTDQTSWAHQARLKSNLINLVANESHIAALSTSGVWLSGFSDPGVADITSHPESAFIIPGDQVSLEVQAIGNEALSYQWYLGASGDTDNPIDGATTSAFTTPELNQTTEYWVRVSNAVGDDDSFTATLRMQTWPEVTDQPDNAEVEIGRSYTIRVAANGENLSYQWFYGISGDTSLGVHGATGSSVSVRPSSEVDTYFWVRVSNDIGSSDSSTARISGLLTPPRIRTQPIDKSYFSGTTSSISISVEGYGLTYQWYRGQSGDTSELLRENTSSSYTVYQTTPDVYEYWVRVSNAAGWVDSRTVEYEILSGQAPVISKSPLSVSVYVGESTRLSVTSHGNDRDYQWYAGESGDTSLPLNATSSSFEPSALFIGTTPYWVRVYNDDGYADSETANVEVLAAGFTAIEKQPLDFTAYRNSGTSHSTLTVEMANPGEVVSYQWYTGMSGDTSVLIADATNSTYSPDLSTSGIFYYWVRVTTTTGAVDSHTSIATILPTPFRITEQPKDQYEFVNQSFSYGMSARVTGDGLSYQWYEGNAGDISTPLLDETSSALYSPFETVGEGDYWVRISSGSEFLDSRTVTYGVLDSSPYISRQPDDVETTTGSSSRIYVSVSNSSNYSYQWYEGESGDVSTPVIDAIEYDLDISPMPLGVYRYWVRVSDANDSVDSQSAMVTVQPSDYLAWATHFGIEGDASSDSSSGDGMSNMLKYATGLNPTEAHAGSVISGEILSIGNQDYFTFEFPLRSNLSDMAVYVEATSDLSDPSSWATTPVDMGPNLDNGDGTVTYTFRTLEPLDGGHRFMRLMIEESP